MAGDEFEEIATDELGVNPQVTTPIPTKPIQEQEPQAEDYSAGTEEYTVAETSVEAPAELSYEDKVNAAMQVMCPLSKFSGKTLGEVLRLDAGAIKWTATKYSGDEKVKEAAMLICEYALQQSGANA